MVNLNILRIVDMVEACVVWIVSSDSDISKKKNKIHLHNLCIYIIYYYY